MYGKNTSEHLAEALERTRRQWQPRRPPSAECEPLPAPVPPAFTVAVSREAGANGGVVARTVGERLGWPVYDRELLQRVAQDMGVRAGLLEGTDERQKSWLQECLESFGSFPTVSDSAYVRHLLQTLLSLSAHGNCVIVGRGAAQILPAATTLRVRLVGPVADRIKTIEQRLSLTHEEAARRVGNIDAERARFVREHFQKDPNSPWQYDLVLNSARFSTAECAELIIEALHRLQAAAVAKSGGQASA
jgi:cytidylate kinase